MPDNPLDIAEAVCLAEKAKQKHKDEEYLANAVIRMAAALRDLRDSYLGDGEGRAWCERMHGLTDGEVD